MKKLSFVIVLSFALVLLFGGVAYANMGAHGGYASDTDSCAGCHRAHTSFSTLTWEDTGGNDHSALLVSNATTMLEFCYACHGDDAPGASTNVASGIFDTGPTGDATVPDGASMYSSNSAFGGALNGGGFMMAPKTVLNDVGGAQTFAPVTSMHAIDQGLGTDPMWGAGSSLVAGKNLTCTDCHDPHGSENYRALKSWPNPDGLPVSGYIGADGETPNPVVWSAEEGYPTIGWLKHDAGAAQMALYRPNYTTAEYKYNGIAPSSDQFIPNGHRSISTWCASCHEQYDDKGAAIGSTEFYDYGLYEQAGMTGEVIGDVTQLSGTGAVIGNRARHRHPVNISLAAGVGPTRALQQEVITSTVLPLEYTDADSSATGPDGPWSTDDYLGCLTCHRAHGSSSDMTGWAEASYVTTSNPSAVVTWYPKPLAQPIATNGGNSGVNPNFSSAILRADNRGVCERCHNK